LTSEPFGAAYAAAYDALYSDKDYPGECDLLERLFHEYGRSEIRYLLDLGCGTGSHALILAERGYDVVGVDRSEAMLAHARSRAAAKQLQRHATFLSGDVRRLDLGRTFDVAVLLFAVLGYQTTRDDVVAALRVARKHLKHSGLLLFDVWYGPAVLAQRPEQRTKVVENPSGRLVRTSSGTLDERRQLCTVSFRVSSDRARSADAIEEEHTMRYFFPDELEALLGDARFSLLRIGAFPQFDHDPDETSWTALVAARAASAGVAPTRLRSAHVRANADCR
jgi:SAM-dependent methyltransferase